MKKETQDILNELAKSGFDVSSIQRQMQTDPLLNKAGDRIIGDGILRQGRFTQYMQETDRKAAEIQAQAQKLATLHDASKNTNLPQETLDVISALEEALVATGQFTEESVKAVSYAGKKPLIDIVSRTDNNDNRDNNNLNNDRREEVRRDELDTSHFVDDETHRASLANIAYGSIATGLELQAAIDEIKGLGIPVTRAKVKELQTKLQEGFNKGNSDLDSILDEVFEVNKVREAKGVEAFNTRVNEEASKIVAERMKESGAPNRARNLLGRSAPVFNSSKRAIYIDSSRPNGDQANPYKDEQGNIDIAKLEKNKVGDPLLFTARGSRESRVSKATDLFVDIEGKIANDPLYDY